MNVVIQNNCQHALTRKEVESIIRIFPQKWEKRIKTIALYQGTEHAITTQFYNKERTLGVFSPKEFNDKQAKAEAVQEILIGLACIAETGDLPGSLSKSVRNTLLQTTAQIREQCLRLLEVNEV